MTDTATEDPAADFARLMNAAASSAAPADGEAPYGWTTDPKTGERRPKKTAGRPRKSPTIDELKAQKAEDGAGDVPDPAGDQAPDEKKRSGWQLGGSKAKPGAAPVPAMPREGYIAERVNKLYRRAGRFVRQMDVEIGLAIIEVTRPDVLEDGSPDPDSLTVGQAWEEVCRVNPRVRRIVLRLIRGGAYGQLVMAHAPIALAILMKESVQQHLPFEQMVRAFVMWFMPDDEDQGQGDTPPGPYVPGTAEHVSEQRPPKSPNGLSAMLGGLTEEDLESLAKMADKFMPGGQRSRAGTPKARARPSEAPQAAGSPPPGP